MKEPETGEDFAALLEEFDPKGRKGGHQREAHVGDLVRGRIVSIGRDAAFVSLGAGKAEGMLDLIELRDADGKLTAQVGDEIEARVVETGGKAGCVVLRRSLGRGPEAKAELEQAARAGIPVEGTVTGVNKGGVEVTIAGVRGFCPISQLDARHVEDASSFVGQKLVFKITKYEQDRRGANLVVSRRALLEEEARAKATKTREKLVPGVVLPGVVVAIKDFGAFVDIGGLEGMLHASELGFSRGLRPAEILQLGQRLDVQVLKIEQTTDPRRPERISLSLKSMSKDPWEDVAQQFPVGTKVKGKVMRTESFGAFVELTPGVEGLLHVGELSGGRQVRHAKELAKDGDELDVTVLMIDVERRRISLGIGDRPDAVDPADIAAARAQNSAPGRGFGTLGDLLKARKPS
jgi:small subunit ribosomal protein S1